MKIVRIFEELNTLLSFKYDSEYDNEFERLFDLWNDTEYLYNFFEDNKEFLKDSYWSDTSLSNIVTMTIELAGKFEDKILEFESFGVDEQRMYLETIFEPLSSTIYKERIITESKAKEFWLRIYALKVNKSVFIITGGAIKLTQEMKDHEATNKELKKLELCKNFLIENSITDIEQIEVIL